MLLGETATNSSDFGLHQGTSQKTHGNQWQPMAHRWHIDVQTSCQCGNLKTKGSFITSVVSSTLDKGWTLAEIIAMPCQPPQPWGKMVRSRSKINIFPRERGYNLPIMGWSNTEYWQDETEQETRTLLPSLYLGRNFFSDSRLIPLKPSKSTQIYIWHLANHWDGS